MSTPSAPQNQYLPPEQTPETAQKKPFYKRVWFLVLAGVVVLAVIGGALSGGDEDDTAADGAGTTTAAVSPEAPSDPAPAADAGGDVPREFTSALKSAERYSDMMHMSKARIYDQLTSEYADQFSPEAAQYAVDTIDADWNNNALESARNYQDTMSMSPAAIHDQLTSEYGEKFTVEEADFAIANLE
ncbi:Ltp family lipoprotein [Corynebacterium kalidii]